MSEESIWIKFLEVLKKAGVEVDGITLDTCLVDILKMIHMPVIEFDRLVKKEFGLWIWQADYAQMKVARDIPIYIQYCSAGL